MIDICYLAEYLTSINYYVFYYLVLVNFVQLQVKKRSKIFENVELDLIIVKLLYIEVRRDFGKIDKLHHINGITFPTSSLILGFPKRGKHKSWKLYWYI